MRSRGWFTTRQQAQATQLLDVVGEITFGEFCKKLARGRFVYGANRVDQFRLGHVEQLLRAGSDTVAFRHDDTCVSERSHRRLESSERHAHIDRASWDD